jgi:hypothetical protein
MKLLLYAATALTMLSGAAYAQTTSNSGSNSNAAVNTSSGSQSTSISNPRVNVIGNPIGNGASSSNSGARAVSSTRSAAVGNSTTVNVQGYAGVDNSGNSGYSGTGGGAAGDPSTTGSSSEQYIGYGGGYTVRNTPEVIPPGIVGGNACAVGASGGLSMAGFGIAGGATWADKACERRQQAALLFNMGEQKVAVELMCQDDNVRSAMRLGGKPCSTDVAAAQAAPATQVAVLAAASRPIVPAATQVPAAPKPDWCTKAAPTTEASKAYVEQVCGK